MECHGCSTIRVTFIGHSELLVCVLITCCFELLLHAPFLCEGATRLLSEMLWKGLLRLHIIVEVVKRMLLVIVVHIILQRRRSSPRGVAATPALLVLESTPVH